MSETIKLKYKMCGKRRGENDIDEYYIQDDATDKTVAIVYGHGSIGNETHAKELVRRWNAFEDGGLVDELRKALEKIESIEKSRKKAGIGYNSVIDIIAEAALAKS